MGLALDNKALDLLSDLPPYERNEPVIQAVIQAVGKELQLLETTARSIVQTLFPRYADDTYHTLGYFERLFGLPVEPVGESLASRRSIVLGHIAKRKSAAGSDWVAALSRALGPTAIWTHEEGPDDYEVSIHIPYDPAGYRVSQVVALAREITPAHLDVIGAYNEGFLIGISEIGVDAL